MALKFCKDAYTVEELTLNGRSIRYRAYRGILYVERAVEAEYQKMNIFAPEAYYEGKTLNGYCLETAPVFVPNGVGGYMPGPAEEPGLEDRTGQPNSVFSALEHGYVVACPAIRGRTLQNPEGAYDGKAPACVVDYKAAVRFLHAFAGELPGNEDKIITNGTSAGGALSALMGGTGDHPDYLPALEELGAADASDAVYAASCYCPITNLEHADMAYEWEFSGVYDYHRMHMVPHEGNRPDFVPEDGVLSPERIALSRKLAAAFPDYVNSLCLTDSAGNPLELNPDGTGSFRQFIEQIVLESANHAIAQGIDLSDKTWLTIENGAAAAMSFSGWVRDITRMKTAPAFDDVSCDSPENDLFGTAEEKCRHFTPFSTEHSLVHGVCAEEQVVKQMNPMHYLKDCRTRVAKFWRIRHGECDRDTSLAISAILACTLRSFGCRVDYASPWNVPHSGDYDLSELFAWIDGICR